MCTLGRLSRLTLWSCCLLAGLPLQAQEGEGHATLHHPPQDQWLHEKFYSTWHMPDNPSASCCNDAECCVEKTGSTFSFRPKRWNAIGIIRMDEITCAHRRPIPCSRRIPYTASHWEAPHDAPRDASQSRLPRTNRHGLSGDSASKEHAATIPSIGL
jgi:hypothetical protein